MGKSQKKRAMRRHNPMRVPDSHLPKGLAAASSASKKNEAILPIIQKMESPDVADRKWACVAVSNLIQNDPSTRRLLQGKNIVGSLITRLSDNEEEVVVEAAGALRNLCIDGGYEICGEMFNKNIIAPLRTFIPKISSILSQYIADPKSAPENAKKLIYELSENVITILWCLSETSNKALNAINDMALAPFLMSFLASSAKLSIAPVVAAAQCLYVLSDDNPPVSKEIKFNAAYTTCLLDIARQDEKGKGKAKGAVDDRQVTLQVLASGILRNVSPLPSTSSAAMIDLENEILLPLLQPVISSTSLVDTTNSILEILSKQDEEPQIEKLSLKGTPKSDHKSQAEAELERLESQLRTVQLALEILTGVCATLPDPEAAGEEQTEGEDMEDEPDGDVDEDADGEVDNESDERMDVEDTLPATNGTHVNEPSPNFLSPLLQPLLQLIQPTPISFPPTTGTSPHPPTTSALSAIHICALECLNNMFLALSTSGHDAVSADAKAGTNAWARVWAALDVVGTDFGPGQERRRDVWEIAVGVLWSMGNVWKGTLVPREDQVQKLTQLCNATQDDTIRVKCIGTLECLAQHPTSVQANNVIAEYLLSLLPTPTSPSTVGTEPLIQAVSALIDIYSDENIPYDINFRKGGYLQRLVGSVDGVKKAVKSIDRKKEGGRELKLRAEETRDNLVAFVRYRKSLKL